MQTKKEVFLAFYPEAKIIVHPGGSGADSLFVAIPRRDSKSYNWGGSKCFPLGTDYGSLWDDAYQNLLDRAAMLLEDKDLKRESGI
jgi:hypothetical protein